MKRLTGQEKIIYLTSLKKYELEQAKKRPIGQRVPYYRVQTDWIIDELKRPNK